MVTGCSRFLVVLKADFHVILGGQSPIGQEGDWKD